MARLLIALCVVACVLFSLADATGAVQQSAGVASFGAARSLQQAVATTPSAVATAPASKPDDDGGDDGGDEIKGAAPLSSVDSATAASPVVVSGAGKQAPLGAAAAAMCVVALLASLA